MAKNCPDCGYPMKEGEYFCPKCCGIDPDPDPVPNPFIEYIKERYVRHQKEIERLQTQIKADTLQDVLQSQHILNEILKADIRKRECAIILWFIQSQPK